jgi:hypothetical protein
MWSAKIFLWSPVLLFAVSCGLLPDKTTVNDPRLTETLAAAQQFDRLKYGFTPIPTNGEVRVEWRARGTYDRMLHFYGRTSRTIAFRKTPTGWRWIHEQEIFEGPNKYTTVDGTFNESICLTYETERVSHYRTNQLNVSYSGEDKRLAWPKEPTLDDVLPILREWGY